MPQLVEDDSVERPVLEPAHDRQRFGFTLAQAAGRLGVNSATTPPGGLLPLRTPATP
jgi:hypothetical protein